jgi:hypothetical protein
MPFDEGRLWKGEQGAALKRQLQATFQNITRVMDCVGCEKCKLWGKLQTLGALRAGRGGVWRVPSAAVAWWLGGCVLRLDAAALCQCCAQAPPSPRAPVSSAKHDMRPQS